MKLKADKKASTSTLLVWKYAPPHGMWMAELLGNRIMVGRGKHMANPFTAKLGTPEFFLDHYPEYRADILEDTRRKAELLVDTLNKAKLRL